MTLCVPTLSLHGYVRSPTMALSVLLSDALTTYKSQSWLFRDNLTSIPYYVNQYGTKPDALVTVLQAALQTYFERYFTEVVVNVEHNSNVANPGYTLRVGVYAIIDSVPYSVAESYDVEDSAIRKTVAAFNGT